MLLLSQIFLGLQSMHMNFCVQIYMYYLLSLHILIRIASFCSYFVDKDLMCPFNRQPCISTGRPPLPSMGPTQDSGKEEHSDHICS